MTNGAEPTAQCRVTEFRVDGFTRVPGLLTAQEVARYRAAAQEAIERGSRSPGGTGKLRSSTDTWWRPGPLRDLARHPQIGAVAEQLAGGSLRIWGGEAIAKFPHDEGPTVWHDDLTFLPLDARLTLNAWIALVDVPVERGALTFLPRSQYRAGPHRCDVTAAVTHPRTYLFDEWPDLEWSAHVTLPLRAGDVTFHQSRTGHRGNGNFSDETRTAFITTYTDAEATYRPLPGNRRKHLQPGQVPPDDQYPRIEDL